jgi:hypothetical protein
MCVYEPLLVKRATLPNRFVMATADRERRVVASRAGNRGKVRCRRREWPSKIRARPSIRPCRWPGGTGKRRPGRGTRGGSIPGPFEGSGAGLVRSVDEMNGTLKNGNNCLNTNYRHLSNIDCLTVRTACLVCFISTVNGHSKKERKKG